MTIAQSGFLSKNNNLILIKTIIKGNLEKLKLI